MESPRRYHVLTFGCRVNQADTGGIVADLEARAFLRSESHVDADVVVLNTCTVTHRSDADVRKAVRRVERENPSARVIVTGCFAERDPEAVTALSGVHGVVGNAHKRALPIVAEALFTADGQREPIVVRTPIEALGPDALPPVDPVSTVVDRTRPFVKIQDGCDAVCTYCIIPSVRGAARSAHPDRVVASVERLVAEGWVEIVLTGVHLGTYGEALEPPVGLDALVARVLAVPGLRRVRLSCIEPMAFPTGLAGLAASEPRLAPHFHLPLQSGSDRILKRMVRPYRAEAYVELMRGIRAELPGACLGADVIVGFPGETEEDFQRTVEVVAEAGLDYVHVFSYSDREGTASTRLDGKIDPRVIKDRSARLHAVSEARWARYLEAQLGRVLPAVTLEANEDGSTRALSDNFCDVRVLGAPIPANVDVRVRVTGVAGRGLLGALET